MTEHELKWPDDHMVRVGLRTDEANHLRLTKRCACGHLEALHSRDSWDEWYCEVGQCSCEGIEVLP